MVDHVSIQGADPFVGLSFSDAVLRPLGIRRVMAFGDVVAYGTDHPAF